MPRGSSSCRKPLVPALLCRVLERAAVVEGQCREARQAQDAPAAEICLSGVSSSEPSAKYPMTPDRRPRSVGTALASTKIVLPPDGPVSRRPLPGDSEPRLSLFHHTVLETGRAA